MDFSEERVCYSDRLTALLRAHNRIALVLFRRERN